jgi:hypothetical protein
LSARRFLSCRGILKYLAANHGGLGRESGQSRGQSLLICFPALAASDWGWSVPGIRWSFLQAGGRGGRQRRQDQTAGSPGSRSRIRMRSGMGRSWSTLDVSRFELLCRDDRPNCRPGRRRRSLNACPTLRVILNQHPSPLLRSRQRRQRPASSTEMSLSFGKPHRRRTLARSDLTHPDARVGVASSHSQLAANWRGGGRLVRR